MSLSSHAETEERQLDHLKNLVNDCLAEARIQGASDAEVGINIESGLSVTARLGDVETIEHHRSHGLGLTVYLGQRKGSASTSNLSHQAMRDTVAAAVRFAQHAEEDPFAGLPDADKLARYFPELDLYHPWGIEVEDAITMAIRCENAAREGFLQITNSEGATLNSFEGLRVMGNTLGFLHGYASSRHSMSIAVIGEQNDQMQRDGWWTVARDAKDLELPEQIGQTAAERTIRRLGARTLPTCKCPVILAADVASSLLGNFVAAIRGGNLYRKSSFLLDHIGKPVFPGFVQIHEQPHLKKALGSSPYDAEGVATSPRYLVRDGVLESYVLSTYSARKLGLASAGNAGGVHNLSIESGTNDLAALMREMGTGLLITELMGQGVNLVTGDYSRGATGFWVDNGEIQYPVEEFTVAGNLRDMFKSVLAVGNDVDYRGNTRTGSIFIEELTIAGN